MKGMLVYINTNRPVRKKQTYEWNPSLRRCDINHQKKVATEVLSEITQKKTNPEKTNGVSSFIPHYA